MTARKYTGHDLDNLLAIGYYRMQQEMFTTNVVFSHQDFYDVFWLRTLISPNEIVEKHSVFKRNNGFSVLLKEAVITSEIEDLYSAYKKCALFDTPESVSDYLFGKYTKNEFDSHLIEVRDGGRLIGVGYLDKGIQSIAGIMNFYDPDYRKFSIGKYLMLLKIQFASQRGIRYYYTGYISSTYHKYDYKIFPNDSSIEVLVNDEIGWQPIKKFGKEELKSYGFLHNLENQV
jgi:arginine-tRNA-protein transferase